MLAIDLNIGDVVLEDGGDVDLVTLDMGFEVSSCWLAKAEGIVENRDADGGLGVRVGACMWLCIVGGLATRHVG